jgi:hypothetical protein
LVRDEQEAKARAEAEALRKEREAAEAVERERRRQENLRLDGKQMLRAFVEQYGEIEEFKPIADSIKSFLGAK